MFSQDTDLLRLAAAKQHSQRSFTGVIYSHQGSMSIGETIDELQMVAEACTKEELAGQVQYLPLR
jgi:hypothetical protein